MMGRFIGVAFAVPFTYFAARGMIPRSLYPRLGLLFSLGGTQVHLSLVLNTLIVNSILIC